MSDAVQQIKDKLNIIDVISPYVELKPAGKSFKGKSPFTAEKTPSFHVSPDRGMYYCFSTSQGGDMFNFIQAMEGVDFKESLKILADKAGIELVPENPQKRTERERWYAAVEAAVVFYGEQLTKEVSAQEYLEQRGVTAETIAKWRIGFAPGPPQYGWRDAKLHLEEAGYKAAELLKVGLIKTSAGGKEPFDVFRDRIMFPMAEPSGKVVAFSGRILTPSEKAPKYVNSPETELYKKSDLLYGYDKAKNGIRNIDFSLIVEGQFDVVMCHQAGYLNTVAVSGTALTLHHVQLLERLSDKVVLALDADRAGIAAMKKAADVMLRRGLDVKVAELPAGKDPADIIQVDPLEFKKLIGKSVHVIEFLLHVLRREVTDPRSFKLKAREQVLPFILLLPSRIDQEHFVSKVAEYISSTTEAVRYELDRLREQVNSDSEKIEFGQSLDARSLKQSDQQSSNLVAKSYLYLLAAGQVVEDNEAKLVQIEVEKINLITKNVEPDNAELARVVFMLEQQFADLPKLAVQEELVSQLNHFKKNTVRQRLSEQRGLLIEAEEGQNDDGFTKALQSIAEYETKLREPLLLVESFFGIKD